MMTGLWNFCMKVLYFIGAVIFEGFLYYIFREAMIGNDISSAIIYLFDLAFIIWVISEAVIRIVSGGSVTLFKWLIGRFL